MTANNPQVPWTDEQWARVNQVIQDEAHRARVAATFLPLVGPLPPDADFVRKDLIAYTRQEPVKTERIIIDDTHTMRLATLQVKVYLRGAQMADPELTSAISMFRRAANVLARVEDAIVFGGQSGESAGPPQDSMTGLQDVYEIMGGERSRGLLHGEAELDQHKDWRIPISCTAENLGEQLVHAVSQAIGRLEASGHFGPFAVVLDQTLFLGAQTPNRNSLVLPQDRILPFLGGGPLLRSTTLRKNCGVVIALGGAPVELVIATDVGLNFLQVTTDPYFVFRVYEKMALRIKEPQAIMALHWHESKSK